MQNRVLRDKAVGQEFKSKVISLNLPINMMTGMKFDSGANKNKLIYFDTQVDIFKGLCDIQPRT